MIVEYKVNGCSPQKIIAESGTSIEIPMVSKEVKIFFKVMRFISTWCDVKKWDRFPKQWFDEPHMFKYERPPEQRIFILDGSLYFERVTGVTNEMHDDVNDI